MQAATEGDARVARLGECLKALAEPNRLRIFDLLMGGTRCNCEMGGALGMAPNLISHHLSVLRAADLVTAERDPHDARWIYYAINRATLADLHEVIGIFFDPERVVLREPMCGPSGDSATTTVGT